jgi:hypothetical protein
MFYTKTSSIIWTFSVPKTHFSQPFRVGVGDIGANWIHQNPADSQRDSIEAMLKTATGR